MNSITYERRQNNYNEEIKESLGNTLFFNATTKLSFLFLLEASIFL